MILCKCRYGEDYFLPASDRKTMNNIYEFDFAGVGLGYCEAIYVGF